MTQQTEFSLTGFDAEAAQRDIVTREMIEADPSLATPFWGELIPSIRESVMEQDQDVVVVPVDIIVGIACGVMVAVGLAVITKILRWGFKA